MSTTRKRAHDELAKAFDSDSPEDPFAGLQMPGAYPKHKVAKTSKDSNVKTPKTIQATEQHLAAGRDSSSTGARKSKAGNGDMPVEGGSTGEKNRKREEEKSAPQSTAVPDIKTTSPPVAKTSELANEGQKRVRKTPSSPQHLPGGSLLLAEANAEVVNGHTPAPAINEPEHIDDTKELGHSRSTTDIDAAAHAQASSMAHTSTVEDKMKKLQRKIEDLEKENEAEKEKTATARQETDRQQELKLKAFAKCGEKDHKLTIVTEALQHEQERRKEAEEIAEDRRNANVKLQADVKRERRAADAVGSSLDCRMVEHDKELTERDEKIEQLQKGLDNATSKLDRIAAADERQKKRDDESKRSAELRINTFVQNPCCAKGQKVFPGLARHAADAKLKAERQEEILTLQQEFFTDHQLEMEADLSASQRDFLDQQNETHRYKVLLVKWMYKYDFMVDWVAMMDSNMCDLVSIFQDTKKQLSYYRCRSDMWDILDTSTPKDPVATLTRRDTAAGSPVSSGSPDGELDIHMPDAKESAPSTPEHDMPGSSSREPGWKKNEDRFPRKTRQAQPRGLPHNGIQKSSARPSKSASLGKNRRSLPASELFELVCEDCKERINADQTSPGEPMSGVKHREFPTGSGEEDEDIVQ